MGGITQLTRVLDLHSRSRGFESHYLHKTKNRGVEQLVARQAHNLEVACSSPAPATDYIQVVMNAW